MDNKYNVDLSGINRLFNNKTFNYRINGFAYACRIEGVETLSNIVLHADYVGGFRNMNKSDIEYGQTLLGKKKNGNSEIDYFFTATTAKDNNNIQSITLNGHYGDLRFTFTNYCKIKELYKLDKKVMDLPFSIHLAKAVDRDNYVLKIETVNGIETKFTYSKYREHKKRTISYTHSFYCNILDFESVLSFVKSFVYNPELAFSKCEEIRENKKVTYTENDLNKVVMKDANLEKPVGKVKKIVKTIMDK